MLSALFVAPFIRSLKRKKELPNLLSKEVLVFSALYNLFCSLLHFFFHILNLAFNAVVRLCIVDLIPALKRFLKSPSDEKLNLEKCKSWTKLRLHVKAYLADVIRVRT